MAAEPKPAPERARPVEAEERTRPRPLWRRMLKHGYVVTGGLLVAFAIMVAVMAPLLAPADPDKVDPANRIKPPGTEGHLLGTDHLGRDMLSRLVYGGRISLTAGVTAAAGAMVLGVAVGVIAGSSSSWVDNVIMRGIDVLLAFPAILLAVLIVAVLGPGITNAMIAVTIVNVPFYARITRSVTLSAKEQEYIEAAYALGNRRAAIIIRHLLPNIMPYIIVTAAMNVGWMITETAALSFLGLGTQPPTSDWGTMLGDGRQLMSIAPHVATVPGLAIVLVVLGFNMLGDGLRDTLDPRMRQ